MHEALAVQVAGLSPKSKKAAELSTDELAALATEATHAQSSPVLDAGWHSSCSKFMPPLPPSSSCASAMPLGKLCWRRCRPARRRSNGQNKPAARERKSKVDAPAVDAPVGGSCHRV